MKREGEGTNHASSRRTRIIESDFRIQRVETGIVSIGSVEIRANRFDLLQRVADDIAHEVKNPLHAIVINLELIRHRIGAGTELDALARVDVVEGEVGRTNRLIEAIMQLLRPGRDSSTWCDLAAVLEDVRPIMEAVAKARRVTIELAAPVDGSVVPLRRDTVRHALLNLVVNALDAVSSGGYIRVDVTEAQQAWVIKVSDDGDGVAPEVATRIGVPGFTTREGRAGLGLAVVRAVTEEVGGRLELMPADAGGARFALTLPRGMSR